MEVNNIFKVKLITIRWNVLDKFCKMEANYESYIDKKESYETIETYTKRRFKQYLEEYFREEAKCLGKDLLVY